MSISGISLDDVHIADNVQLGFLSLGDGFINLSGPVKVDNVSGDLSTFNGEVIPWDGHTGHPDQDPPAGLYVLVRDFAVLLDGVILSGKNKNHLELSKADAIAEKSWLKIPGSGTWYITLTSTTATGYDGIDRPDWSRGVFSTDSFLPVDSEDKILVAIVTVPPSTTLITSSMIDNSVKKFLSNLDNLPSGGSPFVKTPVRLATITPLSPTATYNNGASGIGATLTSSTPAQLIVDQTAANLGDRILVAGEVAAANNGIYTVTNIGQNASSPSISLPTSVDLGSVSSSSFADSLPTFSVSFWVKTTETNYTDLIGKVNNDTGNGGWELYHDGTGHIFVSFWQPGHVNPYQGTSTYSTLNDGNWHNVTMTFDSVAGATLYIDGTMTTLTGVIGAPSANYSSSDNFSVGHIAGDSASSTAGKIAHLQLWNTTLTSGNVSTLVSGGSVPSGLIASWAFSEGTGTTAADSIGGNTLFFTAVTWYNNDAPAVLSTSGSSYVLTRSTDFNMWRQVPSAMVTSLDGVAEANSEFLCVSPSVGIMGTTAITFHPLATLVPPRLTSAQISAIQNPVEGLVVWNLTTHTINAYDGTSWKAVTLS